jgi:hypothetical protein
MKKLCFLIAILLYLCRPAQADLINNFDGTITQVKSDGTKLMWMQDANYAQTIGLSTNGQITQTEAINWANGLDFAGYTDWRLPVTYQNCGGCGGFNSNSEMGDL